MVKIVYGCVTNSWDRVSRYVAPRVGNRSLVVLWNQTSMTTAYNDLLDHARATQADALILVHDDLELTDPMAESKFLTALDKPDVGIVGVAGGYDVTGLAWWNAKTVGWQMTDSGPLDFGPHTGDVQSLEGSVMAFGRWAIESLRFDERFVGFHGYDDIGMQARAKGKRVVVTDIATHHHTGLGFDNEASRDAWIRADEMFREKWNL